MADLGTLTERLDYQFKDSGLLDIALSHRSSGASNYERLEFLGDSFLNFIVASELYHHRPDEDEGALSRLRASLVRQSTLAEIARELSLGDYLNLGVGELRSGGFRRDSILSDVVESIVGAVLLDGGYEVARALVLRLYAHRIDTLPPSSDLKDPKTRLQELLQSQSLARPEYQVLETSGKSHDMRFTVLCSLPELALTTRAMATSRRKAEQAAAAMMLENLHQQLEAQSE
ncbi:MAG: ribonuclease III [Granulosicoccus sp.]|nr:ribonuclease III [Granulosicoccus sp.]